MRRTTTPDVRLDLAPLIDVVFLLLTFFLFAMLLMVRADALDLRLPGVAQGTPATPSDPLRLTLSADGSLLLNAEPVERADLADAIAAQRERSGNPEQPVLLAVDERCESGRLIGVIDTLTGAGITEFSVLGTPVPAGAGRAGGQPGGGS